MHYITKSIMWRQLLLTHYKRRFTMKVLQAKDCFLDYQLYLGKISDLEAKRWIDNLHN